MKAKKIVAVLLCLITALAVCGAVGCSKEEEGYVARYVLFTDETTGATYRISNTYSLESTPSIPYDGYEHKFKYEFFREDNDKSTGERGRFEKSSGWKTVKEPGQYSFKAESIYKGYRMTVSLLLTIEEKIKLQPEMKFEPNGAIEYTDGEYYKYEYTGEECYPIAYGEYEGKRLDASWDPSFLMENCKEIETNTPVATPINVGKYSVRFSIAHYKEDPDLEIYAPIMKTLIIEIVEKQDQ